MKKNISIVIAAICLVIIALSLILIVYQNNESKQLAIQEKKDKEISLLKKEIDTLKDDKAHYKKLYLDVVSEYENRLHSLGIDEYILTDTGR